MSTLGIGAGRLPPSDLLIGLKESVNENQIELLQEAFYIYLVKF